MTGIRTLRLEQEMIDNDELECSNTLLEISHHLAALEELYDSLPADAIKWVKDYYDKQAFNFEGDFDAVSDLSTKWRACRLLDELYGGDLLYNVHTGETLFPISYYEDGRQKYAVHSVTLPGVAELSNPDEIRAWVAEHGCDTSSNGRVVGDGSAEDYDKVSPQLWDTLDRIVKEAGWGDGSTVRIARLMKESQQAAPAKSEEDLAPRVHEDAPGCAPQFATDTLLPYGWSWFCYDDGSGALEAPDGTRYLDYDFATDEMSIRGGYHDIPSASEVSRLVTSEIVPGWNTMRTITEADPKCFVAFDPTAANDTRLHSGFDTVALSPDLYMDAFEFSLLLNDAHHAEHENHSDHTINVLEWANRIKWSHEHADGSFVFEGMRFKPTSCRPHANGNSLADVTKSSKDAFDSLTAEGQAEATRDIWPRQNAR